MNSNMIFSMAALLKSGRNPMPMLRNMAANDPQAAQIMQLINGKSSQQLREIAYNMAKERNIDIDNLARSLGITIPSQR